MPVDVVSDNRPYRIRKIRFVKVLMWFNAVFYLFVCINVFNILGQEHLHRLVFYFLQVIPKATIARFSLAFSEFIQGLIIKIS